MKRNPGFSISFVPIILCLLFAGRTFGDLGSEFHFEAAFQRAAGMPDQITIKRGRWLQPVDPDDPGKLFQPVILCEDLDLRFNGSDQTESTSLWGFCPTPRLHEAKKGVVWKITDIVSVEIRNEGCTRTLRNKIREANRSMSPTQRPDDETTRYPCPEPGHSNFERCREFFKSNQEIREDYGRNFGELEKSNTCEVDFRIEDGVRRFVAVCWPKVVR